MTHSTAPARRARVLGIALLLAAVLAGALGGITVDRMARPVFVPEAAERSAESHDDKRTGYTFELLDLTPEQRAQIDAVLERRRTQMDSVWAEARPKLRTILDSTRNDIRAILTPEQREEYDRLLEERRAARKREREQEHREQEKGRP